MTGRPPKEIDEKLVLDLAKIHCTMAEIGRVVGCSVDTLERRFLDVVEEGRAHGKSSLRRLQWETAKKGNATMQIWLGKQLLHQRDKTDEEIAASTQVNISQFMEILRTVVTPEQWEVLDKKAREAKENGRPGAKIRAVD